MPIDNNVGPGGVDASYGRRSTSLPSFNLGNKYDSSVFVDQNGVLYDGNGKPVYLSKKPTLNSYTSNPGELLFDTSVANPPDPTGATGTASVSNTVTWQGKRTWKLSNETAGGNIAFTIPVDVPAQPAMVGMFFPVFIENYEAMLGFEVYVSMGDDTYTDVYKFTWGVGPTGNEDKKRDGWHLINIPASAWAIDSGAPAAQAIKSVRLRWVRQPGTKDATVYVGSPRVGIKSRPQVLIYADDVPVSFYKNALPIFDAYGLHVNLACAANWANTSQYMTTAMYFDAIDRGHEVCCHTTNRIGVQLTTLSQVRQDLVFNSEFVKNTLGQEFGSKHWVFANGQYWITDRDDYSVLNMMRDELGFVLARTTDDPLRPTQRTPIGLLNDPSRYNILTIPETLPNVTSTTSSLVLSQLGAAIDSGDITTLIYHDTSLSPTIVFENTTVIEKVCELLAEKKAEGKLDVPKGSEFYKGLTEFK